MTATFDSYDPTDHDGATAVLQAFYDFDRLGSREFDARHGDDALRLIREALNETPDRQGVDYLNPMIDDAAVLAEAVRRAFVTLELVS